MKDWVWGSLDYATKLSCWDENFKCGHYDGKGKVAGSSSITRRSEYGFIVLLTTIDWLHAQPRIPMASSVLTSGPYM